MALVGQHIAPPLLAHAEWTAVPATLPVIALAFVYHNIVPIVCRNLEYDINKVRLKSMRPWTVNPEAHEHSFGRQYFGCGWSTVDVMYLCRGVFRLHRNWHIVLLGHADAHFCLNACQPHLHCQSATGISHVQIIVLYASHTTQACGVSRVVDDHAVVHCTFVVNAVRGRFPGFQGCQSSFRCIIAPPQRVCCTQSSIYPLPSGLGFVSCCAV